MTDQYFGITEVFWAVLFISTLATLCFLIPLPGGWKLQFFSEFWIPGLGILGLERKNEFENRGQNNLDETGQEPEGDDRGWDGWMASPTQWTWVWVHSGSWWWTGRPGMLRFMGHWATELNWTENIYNSKQTYFFHSTTVRKWKKPKCFHQWMNN